MKIGESSKGNAVLEVIAIVVIMLALGIVFMVVGGVFTDVNNEIQNDADLSANAKQLMNEKEGNYASFWDEFAVFIIITLSLFAIVSAFFVDVHPLFFVFSLILLIVALVAIAGIVQGFQETAPDVGTSAKYPKIFWIFDNLLTLAVVDGLLILGALYAKSRLMA